MNAHKLTRKWRESCKTKSKNGVFGIPSCYEKSYEFRFRKTVSLHHVEMEVYLMCFNLFLKCNSVT